MTVGLGPALLSVFQVARGTVSKWAGRYWAEGTAAMADRSSRPKRSPNQTARRTQRRIVALRVTRRWGPHPIGVVPEGHQPQHPQRRASARSCDRTQPTPPQNPRRYHPRRGPRQATLGTTCCNDRLRPPMGFEAGKFRDTSPVFCPPGRCGDAAFLLARAESIGMNGWRR